MEQHENDGARSAGRRAAVTDIAGNPPHASIVWGGAYSDRSAYAYMMAQALLCDGDGVRPCGGCVHCTKTARRSHPDIIFIDRQEDARAILVDQIRALKEDAIVMPNEASAKVYIINHSDAMNTQAQNAILKLLEEPPECSNFILTAENPAGLLPTVRSRCIEFPVERTESPHRADETVGAFIEALCEGGLKMCAFSFDLEKLDKSGFIDFIAGAGALLEEKLRAAVRGDAAASRGLTPGYLIRAVRVLTRAKDYFDTNVGLVHIAGMICAELTERNEDSND
jgi:hypothetical protein